MPFRRRSDEENAARAERRAEKKAQAKQRADEFRANWSAEREKRKTAEVDSMKALLQEGETLDGMFRTNDVIVKKHVLVTSRRIIIGFEAESAESIFYRHIAGLDTSNFITKDFSLAVSGRKDKVNLTFQSADDRDRLRDLISARLVAE